MNLYINETNTSKTVISSDGRSSYSYDSPQKQMLEEIKNELLIRDFLVEDT